MIKERDALIDSITPNDGNLLPTDYSHALIDLMEQIKTNQALIASLEE